MYNFDEGAIDLPSEWTDRSVHLFERPAAGGGSFAMSITREIVADTVTVEDAANAVIATLEPRLRRFELISRAVDRSYDVPAIRLRYRFFHHDIGQAISTQLLLRYEKRVVGIVMTAPGRVEDEVIKSFDSIVKTLKLRRRAG